jgi:diadenosine tetraphosphate (Ap4A) HIT family hydrolase
MSDAASNCVFCRIADGKDEKTNLLYQDDKFVVFSDLRPAAEHHYLVCPREHIRNAKILTKDHLQLVETLVTIGKQVLQEHNGDVSKARFGFHWPPFCSIPHLHLHVISPADGIRTFYWLTGVFSPSMPWFRSVEWVIDRMKSLPSNSSSVDG